MSLKRPADVSFSRGKARIYLDLEEETTNSFKGVLGLQQNQQGGTSLVGSIALSAKNLFSSGHQFKLNWESFAENSQKLDLYYLHAFPLKARISPHFGFSLIKQDTTFITRTTRIGVNTFIGSKVELQLIYEGSRGSLISPTVEELELQDLADYRRSFYEIGISKGFPALLNSYRRGISWSVGVGIGSKEIERNGSIPRSFYDTLSLRTDFFRLNGRFTFQIKVAKRQAIYHDIQVGILENQQLLVNELYRIGGLSTLRGFNEQNFFAKNYGLSRLEFRSFFENESYLYAFYDQLVFQREAELSNPFGIGLGFALDTSTGQFSFALGAGKDENQNLAFSELRVHFGFTTKF